MNNDNRKPLIGIFALAAALAVPAAFAQSAQDAQDPQPQRTQQTDPTEQATGSTEQEAMRADTASSQRQQGWADLDSNGDGAISREEAAANAGLSEIFSQADADADGSLTQDEYKSFVEKNYGEPKK